MLCNSVLAQRYRARFHTFEKPVFREVIMCPTHQRECDEFTSDAAGGLCISEEGMIYPSFWMSSLGFLS